LFTFAFRIQMFKDETQWLKANHISCLDFSKFEL
jgi:hypothetical protein